VPVTSVVVFIVVVGILAACGDVLARLLRLPLPTALVLIGAAAGQLVELSGFDTGFRYHHFNEIVLIALLPPLVFLGGLELDLPGLRADAGLVLAFAVLGLLIVTFITAAALYIGIDHPRGFPWTAALLTGALLAATDPGAMLNALRSIRAPQRVIAIIDGEGLFNDAGSVVLFSVLLALAIAEDATIDLSVISLQFAQLLLGGCIVGAVFAAAAVQLLRVVRTPTAQSMLSVALAYGVYLIAEQIDTSGVMATLTAAVLVRMLTRRRGSHETIAGIENTWRMLGYMAEAILFLLVGFAVTIAMFRERWLAMAIGIGAVVLARVVAVYGLVGLRNAIRPTRRIPVGEQTIMVWAGVRGGVTLVLALALPTTLPYWWTIQSIAFGVVLFTLLLQAPLTNTLVRPLIEKHPP
jgi:CPA1 family monovalent cation:H+ antiporter